jgi:hypothetical protein
MTNAQAASRQADDATGAPGGAVGGSGVRTTEAISDAVVSALDTTVSAKCTEITDRFRIGSVGKAGALLQLQQVLSQAGLDADQLTQAFESYIRIIDSFERFRSNAAAQGGQPGLFATRRAADAPDLADNDPVEQVEPVASSATEPTKRARSPDDEVDDTSIRKRVDMRLLSWVTIEEETPTALIGTLRQTHAALENFSRDLKAVKASLLNSPRVPAFPDSQWDNIVRGRSVDLDVILSSQYTISHDERRTEHFGTLEVVVGTAKPTRTVTNHGQWVGAWQIASTALTFVFPWRADELYEYGRHITKLFMALHEQNHHRVIHYDRAVRATAASSRTMLLTDQHHFLDLYTLWIHGAGAGGSIGRGPDREKKGPKSKRDPCNRWNSGRCPNESGSCKYAHLCGKCRKPGHTSADCKQSDQK